MVRNFCSLLKQIYTFFLKKMVNVPVYSAKIWTFSSVGYRGGTEKHTWTWSALAWFVLVYCTSGSVLRLLYGKSLCCRCVAGIQDLLGFRCGKLMCCLCVAGTGSVLTGLCAPTVTGVRAAPSRPSCAGTTGTVSGDGSVHQGQELQLPHSFYFRW